MASPEPELEKREDLGPIPCASPPARTPPHVYDEIIKVTVGPDGAEKTFQVYRGLLCYHSEYFNRMLNGGFAESGSDELRLDKIDVVAFQNLYSWMYTGQCDMYAQVASPTKETLDCQGPYWTDIISLYLFADYVCVTAFKNHVLDGILLSIIARKTVPINCTSLILDRTNGLDPLWRLIVDRAAETWSGIAKGDSEIYSTQFFVDYVSKLKGLKKWPGCKNLDKVNSNMRSRFCERYHVHESKVVETTDREPPQENDVGSDDSMDL